MKQRMKELVVELNEASNLYYNGGESPLTDKEFDAKLKELAELEEKYGFIYCNSPTVNVGSPVLDGINQVEIKDKPMLSLDKVHSAKEIEDFSDGWDIIATIKCDGLSVRLIYEKGVLVSANTRGNGTIGSDISEHIKYFLNVPLMISKKERYIIDGEAIIYDKDFEIINRNNEFKNNRNTASGSLALLDMSIVKNRRLSFIAWDVIQGGSYSEYHYNIEEAEELGFTVVPGFVLDCTKVEENEINSINTDLLNIAHEKGIPCDGVVWRINNISAGNDRGRTAHHFLNAIAWKPHDEEYETELCGIEWSMGRTGVLTPVAIFKPIDIDGSTVERASLHNVSVMREVLGEYPELKQTIWVAKMNQIIPQIVRAKKNDIPHDHVLNHGGISVVPVCCPVCGGNIKVEKSPSGVLNAVCINPECDGKLINRIDHYCGKKGLDIKGISKATIEKLINWGWINDSITELYDLQSHRTEWINKPGFGAVSVDKILNAIDASKSNTSLAAFISGIGIPLVGSTIAKEIVKYYSTWWDFKAAVGGDWTELDGFGPEISNAINSFDYAEADKIAEMLTFAIPDGQDNELVKSADGITFCITGKLTSGNWRNRDELKAYIELLGGKVSSSVTSKTNYLINNDSTSQSSKNLSAQKLGVKIITEAEFIDAFGQK